MFFIIIQSVGLSGKDNFSEKTGKQTKTYVMKNGWEESFLQGEKFNLISLGIISVQSWDKNLVRIECIKEMEYGGFDLSETRLKNI